MNQPNIPTDLLDLKGRTALITGAGQGVGRVHGERVRIAPAALHALERVGRFDDALARYRKAIEIDPSVPHSYLFVGSAYAHGLGKIGRAHV